MWDQPMKPMEIAIWWIEYVIRHKGAEHLRSPAVDKAWFKLYSLDVISFLAGSFILSLSSIAFTIKFVIYLYTKDKIKKD